MQSGKNILQEKLQKLYNITMEVNEIMPPEEKCPYKWQDFFEECANLRDAFFDIGTEDGIVPDFSEVVPVEEHGMVECDKWMEDGALRPVCFLEKTR